MKRRGERGNLLHDLGGTSIVKRVSHGVHEFLGDLLSQHVGNTALAGTYVETITGLSAETITVSGSFTGPASSLSAVPMLSIFPASTSACVTS